jgi:hypothetical protein
MSANPDFDEVAVAVATRLSCNPDLLTPDTLLTPAICRDAFDLYQLHLVLDRWVPGFELPEQLERATLGDAHHYLVARLAQISDSR